MKQTNTAPASISVRYVRGMVAGIERRGLDAAPILRGAGIGAAELEDPRARISFKQFSRIYTTVVGRLDDEALGLGVTPFRRGGVEIVCRAACTGRNLLECMNIMALAKSTQWLDLTTNLVTTEEGTYFAWRLRDPTMVYPPMLYEILIMSALGILNWLAGVAVPTLCADFPFPAPRHQSELQTLVCETVRFDQSETRLWFPLSIATMPLRRQLSDIDKFIHLAPLSFIESILARGFVSLRVRELLRDALPNLPTINHVAQTLALSPRSLHRKLEQEGESFQSVKDGLRCDLAIQMLTRTATPLKQVAHELGFSDQTTFQRAFLAWTGTSPGAYREASGAQAEQSPPLIQTLPAEVLSPR